MKKEFKKEYLRLYAITKEYAFDGTTKEYLDAIGKSINAGVTMVQMRQKGGLPDKKEELARKIQSLCRQKKIPFIVNDDVYLAKKINADGVHIGQKDMSILEARKILGEGFYIGVTAKTIEQVRTANRLGADYIGSGAVFATKTKDDAVLIDWQLLNTIGETSKIPVVAIGGITPENAMELRGLHINGIAVSGGIYDATDITVATKDLYEMAKKCF